MARSRPFKEDRLALPLSTPLFSMHSRHKEPTWCIMPMLNTEQSGYQEPDPGGVHNYVGSLGQARVRVDTRVASHQ